MPLTAEGGRGESSRHCRLPFRVGRDAGGCICRTFQQDRIAEGHGPSDGGRRIGNAEFFAASVARPGRGLFYPVALGWVAQRASCGAAVARAVDAPNLLLQPTLDPVACPLPRPVASVKPR